MQDVLEILLVGLFKGEEGSTGENLSAFGLLRVLAE